MRSADFNIQSVANVVHSWMSYIYEVSDTEHLAAESSLAYPIVGYFERSDRINICMEDDLPSFHGKRVDFKWMVDGRNYYMEMKYVRPDSINIQGIYNDIFRLALIDEENSVKYFLLCGEVDALESKIFQQQSEPFTKTEDGKIEVRTCNNKKVQSKFAEILSFNIGKKSSSKTAIKKHTFYKTEERFQSFVENKKYFTEEQRKNAPTSIRICTELVQPYSKGLKSAVAIWEIKTLYVKYKH